MYVFLLCLYHMPLALSFSHVPIARHCTLSSRWAPHRCWLVSYRVVLIDVLWHYSTCTLRVRSPRICPHCPHASLSPPHAVVQFGHAKIHAITKSTSHVLRSRTLFSLAEIPDQDSLSPSSPPSCVSPSLLASLSPSSCPWFPMTVSK